MLGFLPLATGTGTFILLDKLKDVKDVDQLSPQMNSLLQAVGPFGFLITLGLFSYEIYGIKKCGALIKAGQQMEHELNIENGQFIKRPHNVARHVNEPFASGIIYSTVLAAWAFFALAFIWPKANPWIPIGVLIVGFVWTLIFDYLLGKADKSTGEGNLLMSYPGGGIFVTEEWTGKFWKEHDDDLEEQGKH